jgi:hypothetical protein
MKHRYYSKTNKKQKQIQLKIGVIALSLNLIVLFFSVLSGLYLLLLLSITITLSIIAPFFDIPAAKKRGKLIYYSSLFIAEKEKKGIIKVHGGSLFDYVFVIDKSLSGMQRTNFILQKYLEGILNLIKDCEENQNTSLKIKGTSYILNERTAKKIGFEIVRTELIQTLILSYNYVNILISNSFAKRKLSFPKLNNVKTFETNLEKLIKRRAFIEKLNERLKKTAANTL